MNSYKIRILKRNPKTGDETEYEPPTPVYSSLQAALGAACDMAEEEIESLKHTRLRGMSYSIPDDLDFAYGKRVKVVRHFRDMNDIIAEYSFVPA